MKKILTILFGITCLFSFSAIEHENFFVIPHTYAACTADKIADGIPCSDTGFTAPDKTQINSQINEPDFRTQVLKLVNYFLTFLGLLAVVALVYAGVMLVGDFEGGKNVDQAKKIIVGAAAGIIIVLLSYAFVNWIVKAGGGTNTQPVTTINTATGSTTGNTVNSKTQYLDQIDGILKNLGKLDQNTSKLLELISKAQNKTEDYSDQFAQIAEALTQKSGTNHSYYDTIKESMNYQGYEAPVAESIINKIKNGETLTIDDYNILKNSLRYGFMLQQFETELNILYKSMPQTAENVAAYNDVITLFMEVKNAPTNDTAIQKLQDSFNRFKQIIQSTPFMIANINVTPASGAAPLIITLDGSDSTDPHNVTIPRDNYVWTYIDHQGVEQTIGKGPILEYELKEPGLFIIQLRVITAMTESGYKTAIDGIAKTRVKVMPEASTLNIMVENKKVDSIRKIHISKAKEGITFDATKSAAQVGRKIVEYKWTFGDGATDYSENGDPVSHVYDKVGQYPVRLETKDNTGTITFKEFKIIVEYVSADIEATPTEGNTQTVFELNGLKSKSSDFIIQSYTWEVTNSSGNIVKQSDQERFTFHPQNPGDYNVKLTIQDGNKNKSSDIYILHVKSLSPIASFTARHKSYSQPAVMVFDASSSNDPGNNPIIYSWDFNGDGIFEVENTKNTITEYTYPQIGSFKPVLKIANSYGETDTLTQIVNIDSILAVDFSVSSIAAVQNSEITLTPQSAHAKTFYWDFGDGTHQSAGSTGVTHSYKTSGNYTIALTAFDDNDNENQVSKRIFIGNTDTPIAAYQIEVSGEPRYPTSDVCGQKLGIVINRRDNVKFMGSPSLNIDGSNNMLNFTWDFGDSEFGTTKIVSHHYAEVTGEKCFSLVLTVSDRTTGKTNQTDPIAVQVINMPASLQRLLVNSNTDNKELYTPLDIRLQAQGAFDPDGTIVNYRWWYRGIDDAPEKKLGIVQTQQPFANLTIDSHGLPGVENEYIFTVEMADNEGKTVTSDDLLGAGPALKVKNGNVDAPEVDFTMDKNQIFVGDTISLLAQIKNIPVSGQSQLSFEWDFDGDGTFDDITSGMQVSRKFDTPGTYETRLRVKYKGLITSKTHTVFVDKISKYPHAAFTFQTQGLTFQGNAETSKSDPALSGSQLQYFWDFDRFTDADGDGNTSNDIQAKGTQTQYAYDRGGTYYVILRVRDSTGAEDNVERKIEIQKGTNTGATQIGGSSGKKITSIHIRSNNNPITTLELSTENDTTTVGSRSDITAHVLNADGTPYAGEVDFSIVRGKATLQSSSVQAINGIASTTITPLSTDIIIIKAVAKNTFYQTLIETLSIQPRNASQ